MNIWGLYILNRKIGYDVHISTLQSSVTTQVIMDRDYVNIHHALALWNNADY